VVFPQSYVAKDLRLLIRLGVQAKVELQFFIAKPLCLGGRIGRNLANQTGNDEDSQLRWPQLPALAPYDR